jgi:hypothetical protein
MLTDVKLLRITDIEIQNKDPDNIEEVAELMADITRIRVGAYLTDHHALAHTNDIDCGERPFVLMDANGMTIPMYGHCDDPCTLFDAVDFNRFARPIAVFFQATGRLAPNSMCRSKWATGTYFGRHKPTTVYIDEDQSVDRVFRFDVFEVTTRDSPL